MPTGWSVEMKVDGGVQTSGYEMSADAGERHQIQISITAPASPDSGACGYVIVKAQSKENVSDPEIEVDMVKCAFVGPIVTVTDIETEMEQLYGDEILFPSGATYDNATVVQAHIDKWTDEMGDEISNRMHSVLVTDYELLRAYITNRVKNEIIWRAVELSIDGGGVFINTLQRLHFEGQRLINKLRADTDAN
jgi:hypothetical protein